MALRIAVACGFIFAIALALPGLGPSSTEGELEVTLRLDPRLDPCGFERIEDLTRGVGMWVRQDPMPLGWTDAVPGVLAWSGETAVFTSEDGTKLRYRYQVGSIDCDWG